MTLLLLAYLAGLLTIVSPCILPVLPFVLTRADRSFRLGALPMILGLAFGFLLAASLGLVAGNWAIAASQHGRYAALLLLGLFGVGMLLPAQATRLLQPVGALGDWLGRHATETSTVRQPWLASGLLGVATGLVWVPCAGPILGVILTGAAVGGLTSGGLTLLAGYAAGAATALLLASAMALRMLRAMRRLLPATESIRRGMGALVVIAVCAIALGLDTKLLARTSLTGAAPLEEALLGTLRGETSARSAQSHAAVASLPVLGQLPSLDGAVAWLNTPLLTPAALRGKVVLVNFWTYSCINCLRTLPFVRAWAERHRDRGLVVIGIHTPEFAFERKTENVERALRELGIGYPVAVDSRYALWRAFGNRYWPALYLVDAQGRIRHAQFGEGASDRMDRAIRALLIEAGEADTAGPIAPEQRGTQAAPDLANLQSPETYLGYRQSSRFVGRNAIQGDVSRSYRASTPSLNEWSLDGRWTVGEEHADLDEAGGSIVMRFHARDLHLVLGARDGRKLRFQITIDGHPPNGDHGDDVDAEGVGTIDSQRLYQLIRQRDNVATHLFEIRFLDAGAQAYAFTFG